MVRESLKMTVYEVGTWIPRIYKVDIFLLFTPEIYVLIQFKPIER